MAGFRDFLMRFRPVASPGHAAPAGVPADRSTELSAELGPSLSLLEEAEAQAQQIRVQAGQEAARRREAAENEAARIIEGARAHARDVRAENADRVRRTAEAELADILAASEHEVAAVRRRAADRLPGLVERAKGLVSEEAGVAGFRETSP